MEPAKLKVKIRIAEVEGDWETLAQFIGPIVAALFDAPPAEAAPQIAAPKRPARKPKPSAPITDRRSRTKGSTQ